MPAQAASRNWRRQWRNGYSSDPDTAVGRLGATSKSGGFFLRQPDQPKFVLNRPGRPVVLGQLVRADSICRRKDLRQETGSVQQGDQRQDPVIRSRLIGLCLGRRRTAEGGLDL